uniref:Uncharacterized protein n=1 Tax=viral metagenome TaxID=1070528 RepID=A0A6C0CLQ6_9ZZZZ
MSTKRGVEDAGLDDITPDPQITISCGDVSVSRTKEEWIQIGIRVIEVETTDDHWKFSYHPEYTVSWYEVLNNVKSFTYPHQAYTILHHLASDRHIHFLDELKQENTMRAFWFYWVLFAEHHHIVLGVSEPQQLMRLAVSELSHFTISSEYYENSPMFYEMHHAYSQYPLPSESYIIQCVYDVLERKFGSVCVYPEKVTLPMHLGFIQNLPANIMLAGDAAYYMMRHLSIPTWMPVEFYVYGSTFTERKQALELFVAWIHIAPNVRTIVESSSMTFIIPGCIHMIRIIYVDISNPAGVLHGFGTTLSRVGYVNHQWVTTLSAYCAQKCKNYVIQDGTLVEFDRYLEKKSHRHYTIGLEDLQPEYTDHILKCIFQVDRVQYTCAELLETFAYRAKNTLVYDKSLETNIISLTEKSKIVMNHVVGKSFVLETGKVVVWARTGTTYAVRVLNSELMDCIHRYTRDMKIEHSELYTTLTTNFECINILDIEIPNDCQVYNSSGILVDIQQLALPFECTMRIRPSKIMKRYLKWKCALIRGMERFLVQPTIVVHV